MTDFPSSPVSARAASPDDAPGWYGADEASAWASGYNAAIEAFGHAQTPDQWQPIETAPRDGSPLLAANSRLPTLPPVMVRWLDEMSNPDTGWCDAATASGDALYYNANYFDLWMPAPTVSDTSTTREGK